MNMARLESDPINPTFSAMIVIAKKPRRNLPRQRRQTVEPVAQTVTLPKPGKRRLMSLPTPRSMPPGYDVNAWCRKCQHTVRLDLAALIANGHGDVLLVNLPLRCRCGSPQFGIIVGAISAGKWRQDG